MAKKQKKQEALSVSRLINEVLVAQLSIPFRQIVNDTTFSKYTGSKRPDILISEFEYDGTNDEQYIKNLVAYAEAKDDCKVEDKDWKDALKQGKIKAPKLGLPYFIVTNCKTTYFYNAKTLTALVPKRALLFSSRNLALLFGGLCPANRYNGNRPSKCLFFHLYKLTLFNSSLSVFRRNRLFLKNTVCLLDLKLL